MPSYNTILGILTTFRPHRWEISTFHSCAPSTSLAKVCHHLVKPRRTNPTNCKLLGDNALLEYELRTANKKKEPRTEVEAINRECLDHFRIYFPSDQTVRAVHSNPKYSIGTICLNPAWWSGANFPRDKVRDCVSERGVLMHNKVSTSAVPD